MHTNTVSINARDKFFIELVQALKSTTLPMREIIVWRPEDTILVADTLGVFQVTVTVNPGFHDVTVKELHYSGHTQKEYEHYRFKIDALDDIVRVIATYLEAV